MSTRLATDDDLMTCSLCKKRFVLGEQVYMKSDGWNWKGIIIFDDKCRIKYYPSLIIQQAEEKK